MKISLLEKTHPCYNATMLAEYKALYEGGDEWRALAGSWFPQHPQEETADYLKRLQRVLYQNHAGPIVDLLAAAVFTEAPQITDTPDQKWMEQFAINVDSKGSSLALWFGELLKVALVEQRAYVWINKPARDPNMEVASYGDEEAAGLLEVFLVPLRACQVIDWELDSRGRLAWIMIRGKEERRLDITKERETVHVWTYIDATRIQRWEWRPHDGLTVPSPNEDATPLPTVLHGFGEIPVACFELTKGLHAMGKLRDPSVAHCRARNDLSYALWKAAHALLCIKTKWDNNQPILGPGSFLRLEGEHDDAFYAEPTGNNFGILRTDITDLREEIYRVVHQMAVGADSNATRTLMSGESKTADWRAMDVVLSALAAITRSVIRESLRLVFKARGKTGAAVVAGLEGWQEEDLLPWLEAVTAAGGAHRLSETYQREVAKRQAQRVLQTSVDEETMRTIMDEIDASEIDPEVGPDGAKDPPKPVPGMPGAPGGGAKPKPPQAAAAK